MAYSQSGSSRSMALPNARRIDSADNGHEGSAPGGPNSSILRRPPPPPPTQFFLSFNNCRTLPFCSSNDGLYPLRFDNEIPFRLLPGSQASTYVKRPLKSGRDPSGDKG